MEETKVVEEVTTYPYTHVRGIEVIASEYADSPLPSDGAPHKYKNMFKVLLADQRELFGCGFCPYTHKSTNGVRAHMKVHNAERGYHKRCACGNREDEGVHTATGCSIGPVIKRQVQDLPTPTDTRVKPSTNGKAGDPVVKQITDKLYGDEVIDIPTPEVLSVSAPADDEVSVDDLLGALGALAEGRGELEKLTRERDQWRERAQDWQARAEKAEAQLTKIKNGIAAAMGRK